jgi:hypothetical protein
MIIKIDAYKIKYQPNIECVTWNQDNIIKSKPKQIIKTNSKLM